MFSLPAFFLVPDKRVRPPGPIGIPEGYRNVFRTVRELRRYPGVGVFILATILYTDTANTVTTDMSLYARMVFEMEQEEIRNLLLFSTVFAAAGAVGSGFLADRIGPKRTLVVVLITWLAAISLALWLLLRVPDARPDRTTREFSS